MAGLFPEEAGRPRPQTPRVSALSAGDLERLGPEGRLERLARRAVVPLDAAAVTVVVSGWLRVFRRAAFVRDVTLVLAGPGEVLAPGTLFGERSAESGAQAVTEAAVLMLAPGVLGRHADAVPGLWAALGRSLARRTLAVQRKLEAVSRAGVEARVAGALAEIAEAASAPLAGGAVRLELPLSQEDLAALAGTTRESASAAVAAFARAGLVRGSRLRGLVLVAPERLSELAAVDFRGR
jgi:CRP/FNR family transcriptional regulator, cyclic AMP receptor protein